MANGMIIYASKAGATKAVSEIIAKELDFDILNAKELTSEVFSEYDNFIFASSTYGDGALNPDWKDKLDILEDANLESKTIALVGIGNQERHGEHFCGGMAKFLEKIKGVNVIGQTELNGYKFNNSEFFKDGKFFGLAVDFKGDENYQKRVLDWVNDIKVKFKG